MHTSPKTTDQQGFASIVVALTIVLVLALLTVGFSQLARREQQGSLDRQLSTQAYYAAESGINDATQQIKAGAIGPLTNPNQCTPLPQGSTVGPNANTVSYSCALINVHPQDIKFSDVKAGYGKFISFTTQQVMDTMTVEWGSTDTKTYRPAPPAGDHDFTPVGSWGAPAVLQFSLSNITSLDRTSMIANTFNTYMYPSVGGNPNVNFASSGTAPGIYSGNCSGTGTYNCKVTIHNITPGTRYAIRFNNYYAKSDVRISATGPTGAISFYDAQASVDVTGKAKDVLRRVQVRTPLNGSTEGELPLYTIESGSTCKRLETAPAPDSTTTSSIGGSPDPCVLP